MISNRHMDQIIRIGAMTGSSEAHLKFVLNILSALEEAYGTEIALPEIRQKIIGQYGLKDTKCCGTCKHRSDKAQLCVPGGLVYECSEFPDKRVSSEDGSKCPSWEIRDYD